MGYCALRKDSEPICRVKFDLPCCAGMLKQARKDIGSILEHFGIVEDVVKRAQLVVCEAFTNVIRHAYDEPGNLCRIELELSEEKLTVIITDTGKGFHPQESLEQPAPNQINGRGLFLIRKMADSAQIESRPGKGTKVTATINLPKTPRKAIRMERCAMDPKKTVIVPVVVYRGLCTIREGAGIMDIADASAMQRLAYQSGFAETARWIEHNHDLYLDGFLQGFEPDYGEIGT